jgi:putative membrane protein
MRNLILRIIINAVAIAITASILPGIHVLKGDIVTYLILGVIFGLVNAFLKPIIQFLSCPFMLITLGLFVLVINGLMLMITSYLSNGRLVVDNIGWAILGGIIMGVVSVVLEMVLGVNRKRQRRD